MRQSVFLLGLLLTTGLLAGCLGGDDEPARGGDDADDEANTGTVKGRVLTLDLNEVENARVALVEDNELLEEVRSDAEGHYEIKNVEAGTYLLQVSAVCCKQHVRSVQVEAGQTVPADVQLERFTADDLKEPVVKEFEWTGFMACGFVTLILAGDACEDVDEESNRTNGFEIEPGLESLTATLVWGSPGLAGDRLQYGLARDPCDGATCSTPGDYYGYNSGESPVELRIDAGEGNGDQSWEDIEETTNVQLRVFPEFDNVNVFYQQEFTVYYHLHYHQKAPEDYDPSPDL